MMPSEIARTGWRPVLRLVAPLAALMAAFAVPVGAQAATFVSVPPATNPSGSGPFLFSFRPTSTAASAAVAYKLPGGEWQRCVGGPAGVTTSVGPLPDGDHQVLIADDYTASSVPIYSGPWYACQEHDPPGTAVSVYNFHVGDPPPAPAPVQPAPAPVQPAPAPVQTQPAAPSNAPLPLSASAARQSAQRYARAKWHARLPKVTAARRVSSNAFTCHVTWRAKGKKRTRTVTVVRGVTGISVRPS